MKGWDIICPHCGVKNANYGKCWYCGRQIKRLAK